MSNGAINRPFKYGPNDRRELIVQDSEVAFRAENDGDGNPIYVGRAKIGILDGELKWQIRFIEYDGNQAITSITWPQNSEGNASSDFEFEWDERANYTYS